MIKYNVYSSFDLNLRYLYGFEEYCRSAQIQFRTVHHNEPRPDSQPEAQSVKAVKKESEDADEMMQQVTAEPGTSEDKPAADADESDAESEKGRKDICSPRVSVCLSVLLCCSQDVGFSCSMTCQLHSNNTCIQSVFVLE